MWYDSLGHRNDKDLVLFQKVGEKESESLLYNSINLVIKINNLNFFVLILKGIIIYKIILKNFELYISFL